MEQIAMLTMEEQEMLATLVETAAKLAHLIEQRVPGPIRAEYDLISKCSVTPWQVLHWNHRYDDTKDDRKSLSLRATLEEVGLELHEIAHEIAERKEMDGEEIATLKRDSHNL